MPAHPPPPALPLPQVDTAAARWFLGELLQLPRLAHHPTCRCYDHHLLRLGKVALCLGCVCMGAGLLTGATVLAWLTFTDFALLEGLGTVGLTCVGVALYLPTVAQPFVQRKPFKIASRFALGVAVCCLWYGGLVLLPWTAWGVVLRGVFVVVFCLTWSLTQRLRARRTPRPCDTCPHGVYPFCRDNRPRLVELLAGLRRRASPEDQPFIDLVAALSGVEESPCQAEVLPNG